MSALHLPPDSGGPHACLYWYYRVSRQQVYHPFPLSPSFSFLFFPIITQHSKLFSICNCSFLLRSFPFSLCLLVILSFTNSCGSLLKQSPYFFTLFLVSSYRTANGFFSSKEELREIFLSS